MAFFARFKKRHQHSISDATVAIASRELDPSPDSQNDFTTAEIDSVDAPDDYDEVGERIADNSAQCAGAVFDSTDVPTEPISICSLIGKVLPRLYAAMPGSCEDEKDDQVQRQLDWMEEQYRQLERGIRIDYSSLAVQVGYMRRYMAMHADLVRQVIKSCDTYPLKALLRKQALRITCLGGGPGSDILGIIKYLIETGSQISVSCQICDAADSWAECWRAVETELRLRSGIHVDVRYSTFDITDKTTWLNTVDSDGELYTLVYFVSEVYRRSGASVYFEHLFKRAKPGATFLVIDNDFRSWYNWFHPVAARSNVRQKAVNPISIRFRLSSTERESDLGAFQSKWGNIRGSAQASWRIFEKVEECTSDYLSELQDGYPDIPL